MYAFHRNSLTILLLYFYQTHREADFAFKRQEKRSNRKEGSRIIPSTSAIFTVNPMVFNSFPILHETGMIRKLTEISRNLMEKIILTSDLSGASYRKTLLYSAFPSGFQFFFCNAQHRSHYIRLICRRVLKREKK